MSLEIVFTEEVLASLHSVQQKSKHLEWRLKILDTRGGSSDPSDLRRAQRAAWDTYISAASIVGILPDFTECDVARRLVSRDDSNFRGAMAECMAAWFFAGSLRWPISPRPRGRGGSQLEFSIPTTGGDIAVEVKAPYKVASGEVIRGTDSDVLERCLDYANKQFSPDTPNLLFLAPTLTFSLRQMRHQIIEAFVVSEKIIVPVAINQDFDGDLLEPYTDFRLTGKFTKSIKPGGGPGFTRVSAAISVEEFLDCSSDLPFMNHHVLVVHNPHAQIPINPEIFGNLTQFTTIRPKVWGWTDGHHLGSP